MRVTKLLSGIFAVLLGLLLVDIAFAIPFDKSDGTLGHGLSSHLSSPGAVNNALLAFAQPPAQDCGDLGNTRPLKNVRALGDDSEPLSGWAGAKYYSSPSGHFTAIQGTFTVPRPVIPAGAPTDGSVSNWTTMVAVWIGGEDPLLSTGVQLFAHLSGEVSFEAWFQGGVSGATDYKDMSISEGDAVTLRIEMYSHTSGIAIIDNITTGKRASQLMSTPSNPLPPPSDAAWIVAVPYDSDHFAPFANFDTVKFTEAVAFTSDARNFGPGDGATANNIYPDSGINVTVTDIDNREVTITYVQRQVEARDNDNLDIPLRSLPASFANVISGTTNDDTASTDPLRSSNWAGAIVEEPPAHSFFKSVEGTFTVPGLAIPSNIAHQDQYHVLIWVGIDGYHSAEALLQAGVQLTIDSATGTQTVLPFYQWFPAEAQPFNDIVVSVGDVVTVRVESTDLASGNVYIVNESTGQSKSVGLQAVHGHFPESGIITGQSVEWIVEDPSGNNLELPLSLGDFGTVLFTDCKAVSDDGNPFGPGGARPAELYRGTPPVPMTDVDISETEVKVTYKPPPAATGNLATRDSATKDYHYSGNWAGPWINPPPNTHFTGISGKFTIPNITAGSFTPSGISATADHDAAIWLGLDGQGGEPGFFQAGIAFSLSATTGAITHSHAWTEWLPQGALSFAGPALALTPGTVISLNLTALSPTTAVAAVENETTGQRAVRTVAAPAAAAAPLRGRFAEWIVEHAHPAGALADFANVTFTHCAARLSDGSTVGLHGAVRDLMADPAARVLYTDVAVDAAQGASTVSYRPRRVDGPLEDVVVATVTVGAVEAVETVVVVVVDERGERGVEPGPQPCRRKPWLCGRGGEDE